MISRPTLKTIKKKLNKIYAFFSYKKVCATRTKLRAKGGTISDNNFKKGRIIAAKITVIIHITI